MLKPEIVDYAICYLVGKNYSEIVAYRYPDEEAGSERLTVLRCGAVHDTDEGFLIDDPIDNPKMLDRIPVLFGEPLVEERDDGRIVLFADVLAAVLYFASRQEEINNRGIRDGHGRFIGGKSYLARNDLIATPVLDMYASFLRNLLRIPNHESGIRLVHLTHDIDVPWYPYTLFSGLKSTIASIVKRRQHAFTPLLNALGRPEHDPAYTFPQIVDADRCVAANCKGDTEVTYFIKVGGNHKPQDSAVYYQQRAATRLLTYLETSGCNFGLHASYEAGLNPYLVHEEKKRLEKWLEMGITRNRNHYLGSLEPEDVRELENAGFKDDYTMGYADLAGFRLGTCRAIRWVDSAQGRLSDVTMHPLTIMDCSLLSSNYMNLSLEEAFDYCRILIDETACYFGELTLLWHNQSFVEGALTKVLFDKIATYIC